MPLHRFKIFNLEGQSKRSTTQTLKNELDLADFQYFAWLQLGRLID